MAQALAHSEEKEKVSTKLQFKLRVGGVNDSEEKEADAVADRVMRMPSLGATMEPGENVQAKMSPVINRKCTDCEKEEKVSRKEDEGMDVPMEEALNRKENEEEISRKEEDENGTMQRKADVAVKEEKIGVEQQQIQAKSNDAMASGGYISSNLSASIQSTRGGGTTLPNDVSHEMGSKIGADFSGVKVHTGSYAQDFNNSVGARAFTVGNDIYFNSGEYSPNTTTGKTLLAHELTHTVQQGAVARREPSQAAPSSQNNEPVVRRGVGEWLAERAWSIAEDVTSPEFVSLLREVYNKGIWGFLQEKLSGALSGIFNAFPNVGEAVGFLRENFIMIYQAVQPIITALANGDCGPLFAALTQLKDYLTMLATTAWDKLVEFVRPIGDFFTGLWASYGAPALDWLKNTAGEIWDWLQGIGRRIWNWTQPIRDYGSTAWNWVKEKLGIGSNDSGEANENGIVQWIGNKVGEVWTGIKNTLRPVIEPVQRVAQKVLDILPLTAITNLSETIQGWLANVNSMAGAMGDNGAEVAAQQASLRETILPAVIQTVDTFRIRLNEAGSWLSEKIGGFAMQVVAFIDGLRTNSWLSFAASLLSWVRDGVNSLADWVQTTVVSLFDAIGRGLQYLVRFIEPVLNMLQQLVDTVGNLMGRLGDFILGPLRLIPECILNPIKDFIVDQILSRIPLFQQLLRVRDAWERLQTVAMTILYQVFVDGNIAGAIWTFFSAMCSILGIPPDLIVDLLRNASQALMDILRNPVQFFINLLEGLKQGFVQFFDNILTHLVDGVADWLFGQMEGMGITRPADLSFSSIFTFILQILGISIDHIFELLAQRIGEERAAQLRRALDVATGVWQFIRDVVERGPEAIWERVSEFLDNLWDGVLNAVVGFITTRIIARATQWLLGFLDISGIMPVINSIIAIYNAIQSAIEYFVPILRIINNYFQMLGSIAKGAIAPAADFLEGILARSIPIIIGFLANQFGFQQIGEHIRGAITGIRTRIDNAILRVIDGAIRVGGAILDFGRGVVAGVSNWWNNRINFRNQAGESHSIYFSGEGANAQLTIESTPTPIMTYLRGLITAMDNATPVVPADNPQRILVNSAITKAQEIEEEEAIISRTANPNQTRPEADAITQKMSELSHLLIQVSGLGADETNLPSPADWKHEAPPNKKVKVEKLSTRTSTTGSATSSTSNPPWFQFLINKGLTAISNFWVKMHIVDATHGGSGTEEQNLTPAPKNINESAGVRSFERAVSNLVTTENSAGYRADRNLPDQQTRTRFNVVWIENTVSDYGVTGMAGEGSNWWGQDLKMRAGLMTYQNNNWVKENRDRISENITIPLPNWADGGDNRPSLSSPSNSRFADTTIPGGTNKVSSVFPSTVVTEIRNDVANNGQFDTVADFKTRMEPIIKVRFTRDGTARWLAISGFVDINVDQTDISKIMKVK